MSELGKLAATAAGAQLDAWAVLWGLARVAGEDDVGLRLRVLAAGCPALEAQGGWAARGTGSPSPLGIRTFRVGDGAVCTPVGGTQLFGGLVRSVGGSGGPGVCAPVPAAVPSPTHARPFPARALRPVVQPVGLRILGDTDG